jgi:hypothetical protein
MADTPAKIFCIAESGSFGPQIRKLVLRIMAYPEIYQSCVKQVTPSGISDAKLRCLLFLAFGFAPFLANACAGYSAFKA